MAPPNKLTFFCTNTAFLPSQIPLASFVPKKKQPYQDVQTPYQVQPEQHSSRPDENVNITQNSSSNSRLSILLTKFVSLSHNHGGKASMNVSAIEGGNVYTLNSPDELFEEIVFGQEHGAYMQAWFERCVRRKWKPRFVVGVRTFFDASVSSEGEKANENSVSLTAPISSAQGDPIGLADVEFQAQQKSDDDTKCTMKLKGERVYSICYWKINISKHGGKITPELKSQKNVWRSFNLSRDEEDSHEEETFQADLEGVDEDVEGWVTYHAEDDDSVCFAFSPGGNSEDEDSEEYCEDWDIAEAEVEEE